MKNSFRSLSLIMFFGIVISGVTLPWQAMACSSTCACSSCIWIIDIDQDWTEEGPRITWANLIDKHPVWERGTSSTSGAVDVNGYKTGFFGTGDCKTNNQEQADRLCKERFSLKCLEPAMQKFPDLAKIIKFCAPPNEKRCENAVKVTFSVGKCK